VAPVTTGGGVVSVECRVVVDLIVVIGGSDDFGVFGDVR
jgi:hypothetical protein